MKLKERIKTYNFWVSLTSALFLIINLIGQKFGFRVDESIFNDVITALCGILVLLGIIAPPSKKLDSIISCGAESLKATTNNDNSINEEIKENANIDTSSNEEAIISSEEKTIETDDSLDSDLNETPINPNEKNDECLNSNVEEIIFSSDENKTNDCKEEIQETPLDPQFDNTSNEVPNEDIVLNEQSDNHVELLELIDAAIQADRAGNTNEFQEIKSILESELKKLG